MKNIVSPMCANGFATAANTGMLSLSKCYMHRKVLQYVTMPNRVGKVSRKSPTSLFSCNNLNHPCPVSGQGRKRIQPMPSIRKKTIMVMVAISQVVNGLYKWDFVWSTFISCRQLRYLMVFASPACCESIELRRLGNPHIYMDFHFFRGMSNSSFSVNL
jgi:hypothetical protein